MADNNPSKSAKRRKPKNTGRNGAPVEAEGPETPVAEAEHTRKDNIYSEKYDPELVDTYNQVMNAFEDKNQQTNDIARFWNVYNCILSPNQYYQGTSQVFLPIVHDAIEARVQRFVNTLFPENGRYTDVIANVPNDINAIMGLLDHYVKRDHLKTKAKELLRNGEVEGQYTVYVDWCETTRYVTKKVKKHPETSPGVHDPSVTFDDVEDDTITDARPRVQIIAAPDLAVLPPTFDNIEEDANIVAVRRFYTPSAVQAMIDAGDFDEDVGKVLLSGFDAQQSSMSKDPRESKLADAGVQWDKDNPRALVFEVWKRMEIDGRRPWCKIYFAGPQIVAGMFVNPNWNDRCPVISRPRIKITGSGWGKSPIDSVEQLQYQANDWANMAGDNGMYSLLPIVMTDPEKNPNLASMVMNLAAVWQTSPNDTKFVEMPQLWKDALAFVDSAESKILKAFSLNPAMISSGGASKQQTQADVAQDQAMAIAITTEEVSTLEEDLFSPVLQRFFELDQQHRDDDATIRIYGQMGIDAKMEAIPPFAWDDRYEISWRGSSMFRSQQQNQNMIAGMNILRSLPPVLPDGKRIDLSPIIEVVVENIYGPRLGSRVLVDQRDQMTVPPELENQLIGSGIQALVHPADNDPQHLQVHAMAMQQGDPTGLMAAHILMHQQAMAQKMQAQQQQQGGLPGAPGQPGIAGTPRPGAQPGPMRPGGQQPAGAIHADRIGASDPGTMPRRAVAG